MPEEKKQRISGGKFQVIRIGLIRIHWYGGKCMWKNCNVGYDLEFAHAVQTKLSKLKNSGRSSYERLKDLMDNPECFLLYCSYHHRMFDGRNSDTWKEDFYNS